MSVSEILNNFSSAKNIKTLPELLLVNDFEYFPKPIFYFVVRIHRIAKI